MIQRPRILVNVAMTADGKIDSSERKGASISSSADKARVDRLRASVDAVLVGGRTLINEDPKLTVKSQALRSQRVKLGMTENPAKVGVVTELPPVKLNDLHQPALHSPLHNFISSGPAKIYLFTTHCNEPEIFDAFRSTGALVQAVGEQRVDLEAVFRSLHESGIRSVLVEGGGTLIAELFRLNLVDELTVYIAPRVFGGASAPTLADGPGFLPELAPVLEVVSIEKFDAEGGILVHYHVMKKE